MLSYFKKLFHQQSYVASALQASDQKGCGKRAYQKASVTVEAAFAHYACTEKDAGCGRINLQGLLPVCLCKVYSVAVGKQFIGWNF